MLTVQIARRTRPWPRRKQFCGQHQRRHTLPHVYALPILLFLFRKPILRFVKGFFKAKA